jgi:hypothetical protein
MSWFPSWPWSSSSNPQAELDAIDTEQKALDAKREAVKAKMSATQQGEALSGPSPPAMGGRRRNKKTRRAKKGKSRKAGK